MGLSFLPEYIAEAVRHLNLNFLSEIRLRKGQPIFVEYLGKYRYLGKYGIADSNSGRIIAGEIEPIIASATGNSIYGYTEQIKSGFITVEHGVRIGIAGEYATQNGEVTAIKSLTSLNIRIPHDVRGCAQNLCGLLYRNKVPSVLLFSKPGFGKTTMLRDIARFLSEIKKLNVLVFDERGEISAMDGDGNGFDLGSRTDVVRCYNKLSAIASAVRAMKPDVIVTDELYGQDDENAVRYAVECEIPIAASSHVCNHEILRKLPFDYFVGLTGIGGKQNIYDKDFNTFSFSGVDDLDRNFPVEE